MPQTIYKTFYACDKCGCEYDQYYKATQCEGLTTLEETEGLKVFEVGDELNFNNERQGGTRWVYESGNGKIIEKALIHQNNNHHQYLYWLDSGDGVVWVQDSFGWQLFSPVEFKRNR